MIDRQYEDMLAHVLRTGKYKENRTGVSAFSKFGHELRYPLWQSFPLITTKKVHLKSIILELLWFLRGDGNATWLQERGCTIWDEWALPADETKSVPLYGYDRAVIAAKRQNVTVQQMQQILTIKDNEKPNGGSLWLDSIGIPVEHTEIVRSKGDLGPVYGVQWRSWPTPDGKHIDQIQQVINDLKNNPDSRRIIVSAWNVAELDKMALHPCHAFFQFYSEPLTFRERQLRSGHINHGLTSDWTEQELDDLGIPRRALSCKLVQRSADLFLGVPFNIASYAMLVHMIAQQTNHCVGDLIWSGGDCHIYENHVSQCELQLEREPYPFPQLNLRKRDSIDDYCLEDFVVEGYSHHPAIKAPVAK